MFIIMKNMSGNEVILNTQYIISIKDCDEKILIVMSGVDGIVEIAMEGRLEIMKEMLNILSFDSFIGTKNLKIDEEDGPAKSTT